MENIVPLSPARVGEAADEHGDLAPIYLMGYFGGEPVYRTINTYATGGHLSLD
jgi:hypothetical protein